MECRGRTSGCRGSAVSLLSTTSESPDKPWGVLMTTNATALAVGVLAVAATLSAQQPDLVSPPNNHPYSRGFAVNVMCQGMHMRGTAKLLRVLKRVEVTQGAETDSLTSGVQGYVKYSLKNAAGNVIATGATPTRDCPAKAPGKARVCSWPADGVDVPDNINNDAVSIDVEPICTDQPFKPFGANWDAVARTGKSGLTMYLAAAGS